MTFRRSQTFFTIEKTAQVTGIPIKDIERHIQMGEIVATFMDNLGSHIIKQPDLIRFLKKQKKWLLIRKVIGSRVLVVDRDEGIQDIIKAELTRSGAEVRVATTENEIKKDIEDFLPEIIAVPIEALQRAVEPLGPSLSRAKEECQSRIVLYYKSPTLIELRQDVKGLVDSLGAVETLSISSGTGLLVSTLRKQLGLR